MTWRRPIWLSLVALAALWSAAATHALSQRVEERIQQGAARVYVQARPPAARPQQTLRLWMQQRANMPLPDMLRQLENEQGFRQANPVQQERMRNQLIRLYNMQPQQRDRVLQGNEALAQMSPEQRQQFNTTMQQYAALTPDRRPLVARAFAALRRVAPAERQRAVATYPGLGQLAPPERQLLRNLLIWEPYFAAQGR
jgi:hypothetical protein